jgi:two-component system, sensor histidine kinase and response regulator
MDKKINGENTPVNQQALSVIKEAPDQSKAEKFVSGLVHDIRSPIATLQSTLELLMDKDMDPETRDLFIKMLHGNTKKVLALIDGILSMQKNSTPENINVNNEIKNDLHFLREEATTKDLKLLLEIDPKASVFADSEMLKTILRNLIRNAIKFTEKEGVVTVRATEKEDENLVKISVTDTGVGMDKDTASNIFSKEEMKTSTPGTNNESGNGLGLMICKDYVEKNGGKILVESKVGEGSTFSFTLPKTAPTAQAVSNVIEKK